MIAVGIDVSKYKSTVAIISNTGEILLPPKVYTHTYSALLSLVSLLKKQNDDIRIVMEATGHYHYPILKLLLGHHFFCFCRKPLHNKKI